MSSTSISPRLPVVAHSKSSTLTIGDHWTKRALDSVAGADRGKELRRGGFALAEERYSMWRQQFLRFSFSLMFAVEYKPTLVEIERLLEEAGLDPEDIKKGGAGRGTNLPNMSRNRR